MLISEGCGRADTVIVYRSCPAANETSAGDWNESDNHRQDGKKADYELYSNLRPPKTKIMNIIFGAKTKIRKLIFGGRKKMKKGG
jgi:hypothetical protein